MTCPAMWGVTTTRGCRHSGLVGDRGSLSQTSSQGARQTPRIDGGEQVGLVLMAAPGRVHHIGAARKAGEQRGVEYPPGLAGERQQADQNVAAREERAEALRPVETFDSGGPFRAAAPSGDRETQPRQRRRAGAPDLAHAHDADPAVAGVARRQLPPQRARLKRPVRAHPAMAVQHRERRIFHHLAGQRRVDEAHHRRRRQRRVGEDVVHPGAERKNHAQARQAPKHPRFGVPHQRRIDVFDAPDLGPHAQFEARFQRRERRRPGRGVVDRAREQHRHASFLPPLPPGAMMG